MSAIVELINQQAEAHRRAAIEAYGQRDAMVAVREENARLGDQIEQLQKQLPGGVKAGGGALLYGPDGKALPIPEKPPVYIPPPSPVHPPAQPFPGSNAAPLGLGGGGGGGAASTGAGTGSPGLLHAIKGPAFASFAWIKANGVKTTVKIPNPANPLALFSNPPDLVDCAAYDCSAQFPPEAIFLDPDAVANLPKLPSISSTSSGRNSLGGSHDFPSASDGGIIPPRHVQQVGTPTDPGTGGSGGGGNTGDLGNGSGGATIGGGKSLQINVQHPPAPRPAVSPDGVLLSRQLAAVLAVMGKVADAVTARGPSANTDFRRNKF